MYKGIQKRNKYTVNTRECNREIRHTVSIHPLADGTQIHTHHTMALTSYANMRLYNSKPGPARE